MHAVTERGKVKQNKPRCSWLSATQHDMLHFDPLRCRIKRKWAWTHMNKRAWTHMKGEKWSRTDRVADDFLQRWMICFTLALSVAASTGSKHIHSLNGAYIGLRLLLWVLPKNFAFCLVGDEKRGTIPMVKKGIMHLHYLSHCKILNLLQSDAHMGFIENVTRC